MTNEAHLIRPATAADAAQLARLRYWFRGELRPAVEDEAGFVARMTAWLAERLGRPQWLAWIAEEAGDPPAIAGHIFVQLIEKLPNPIDEAENLAYITNLYVAPDRRGAGLGGALLRTALAACQAAGVEAVILWPSERSVPLYRRHGFAPPPTLLERR